MSTLYLRAQPLCYRVSPDQGPILSFSQSQFSGPIFTAEGKSWELRAIMREHSHADAAPSPALWSRSVLTVQSQVQCCLALTLRFKHWLQSIAGDMRSGAAISALSQWQNFLSSICSISCLQRSWEVMQICHSMKCYMIFGLCGLVTHKIISQSIISFQTTNVFFWTLPETTWSYLRLCYLNLRSAV